MANEAKGPPSVMDRQLGWVKLRGREHAEEVFRRLHEVVQRDVESAKEHARASASSLYDYRRIEFRCYDMDDWYFGVDAKAAGFEGSPPVAQRGFWLESKRTRIIVIDGRGRGQDNPLHEARPTLYLPQHCLLDVKGYERPMRLWQFSRLVLEPLFFPEG